MAGLGDMTPRRLFLLRHAHPAAMPAVGWADTDRPLTPHGRRQARELGGTLAQAGIELVLCSPALRTRETVEELGLAAPVRHALGAVARDRSFGNARWTRNLVESAIDAHAVRVSGMAETDTSDLATLTFADVQEAVSSVSR